MESLYVAVIAVSLAITPIKAIDCNNDVCAASGHRHVLCEYPDPNPGPDCGTVYSTGMTDKEVNVTITTLNQMRMKVAMGMETMGNPGPQPPAANMRILVWDNELAFIAQRWLNQCRFEYADCVDVDRFETGQTLASFHTNQKQFTLAVPDMITELIRYIHSEVVHVDSTTLCNYRYDPETYMYTQLVWANTFMVGCGKIIYRTNQLHLHIMCIHGPRGNIEGKPVYQVLKT